MLTYVGNSDTVIELKYPSTTWICYLYKINHFNSVVKTNGAQTHTTENEKNKKSKKRKQNKKNYNWKKYVNTNYILKNSVINCFIIKNNNRASRIRIATPPSPACPQP